MTHTIPHPAGPAPMDERSKGALLFRRITAAGAFSAGAAVALGAFGAHGLRRMLSPDMLAVYETGVRYHMYHALALIGTGVTGLSPGKADRRLLLGATWAFGCGTLLFSGSLYTLALTGILSLGAVTPVGGVAFLAGWTLFGAALIRRERS